MNLHDVGIDIRMWHSTGIGTYIQGLLGSFQNLKVSEDMALSVFGGKPGNELSEYPRYPFHSGIYSVQ